MYGKSYKNIVREIYLSRHDCSRSSCTSRNKFGSDCRVASPSRSELSRPPTPLTATGQAVYVLATGVPDRPSTRPTRSVVVLQLVSRNSDVAELDETCSKFRAEEEGQPTGLETAPARERVSG